MTGLSSSHHALNEFGLVGKLDLLSETLTAYFHAPSLSSCEPEEPEPDRTRKNIPHKKA